MFLQDDIEKIIPHRKPMLLIDKITDVIPGEYAKGEMKTSGDSFQRSLPNAVMPGVIIIKPLPKRVRSTCLCLTSLRAKQAIAGIDKAKFNRDTPGDTVGLKLK